MIYENIQLYILIFCGIIYLLHVCGFDSDKANERAGFLTDKTFFHQNSLGQPESPNV